VIRILYLGDIMGRPGRGVVTALLPALKRRLRADLVIAQAENVSHGKGMTPGHMQELQAVGVDFFTGGNHSIERATTKTLLEDPSMPVTAPMNQVGVDPAWGAKQIETKHGAVLVASLLGNIFPTHVPIHNPLVAIDELLADKQLKDYAAVIVNFHADISSEKRVIGYYLDGRVSAVVGDHWHVPSADAMILPKGTAHITDVGMCGTLHSSLGVSKEIIIARWRDGIKLKNDIADGGPYQLNGVLVTVDPKTRQATHIKPVHELVEKLG
jgi:2',3'-cyclic-nucleotide 2'-phosphodiesterase